MVYEGYSRPHAPRPSQYTKSAEEKEATRDRLAERREGLNTALKGAKERGKAEVAKIASDWGASKQKIGLVLGVAAPKQERAASAWSGFVAFEIARLNADLAPGTVKWTVPTFMAAHKEEWEGVDDELREEYRLLAEESREDRKPTTTKSAKNASKDVDAVVHGMIESAKACFVRTGQSFIIMSVKSSTVSYAGATVYVSPPLEKFTGTVFKKTGPEILRLAESWAVHGAEGVALESAKTQGGIKKKVRDLIKKLLYDATGNTNPKLGMSYKSYHTQIVLAHNVHLHGWPFSKFEDPSGLSIPQLHFLHSHLSASPPTTFWMPLTSQQVTARSLLRQEHADREENVPEYIAESDIDAGALGLASSPDDAPTQHEAPTAAPPAAPVAVEATSPPALPEQVVPDRAPPSVVAATAPVPQPKPAPIRRPHIPLVSTLSFPTAVSQSMVEDPAATLPPSTGGKKARVIIAKVPKAPTAASAAKAAKASAAGKAPVAKKPPTAAALAKKRKRDDAAEALAEANAAPVASGSGSTQATTQEARKSSRGRVVLESTRSSAGKENEAAALAASAPEKKRAKRH